MPRNNTSPRKPQATKPRSSRRSGRPDASPRRSRRSHQLRVRSTLRREPDVRRIARAVIQLALVEAEREAGMPHEVAAPPSNTAGAPDVVEVSS